MREKKLNSNFQPSNRSVISINQSKFFSSYFRLLDKMSLMENNGTEGCKRKTFPSDFFNWEKYFPLSERAWRLDGRSLSLSLSFSLSLSWTEEVPVLFGYNSVHHFPLSFSHKTHLQWCIKVIAIRLLILPVKPKKVGLTKFTIGTMKLFSFSGSNY